MSESPSNPTSHSPLLLANPLPSPRMSSHHTSPSPVGSFDQSMLAHGHSHLRSELVNSVYSESSYSESRESTAASSVDEIRSHRPLPVGVYVPTLCFFEGPTEDLDLDAIATHAVRLAEAGVAGITTQGSNGEAVHLTHKERRIVTSVTRRALNEAGFPAMPLIVGCGSQSTRETIELCHDAALAGGDYALVLPPSYYKPLFRSDTAIHFFQDVADASPIPIIIYNYPAAVSGTDLDSDAIITLAKHPNIVGCKLTCGNTGKLNRIAAATRAATPTDQGSGFMCMGGSADFTLQMLVGGGSGVICGLGNVVPKACVEIFAVYRTGDLGKARQVQEVVARGDWAAIAGGIVGTKSALQTYFGYGGPGRRPLPRPTTEEAARHAENFKEVVALEMSL